MKAEFKVTVEYGLEGMTDHVQIEMVQPGIEGPGAIIPLSKVNRYLLAAAMESAAKNIRPISSVVWG
jgi:hypothetical protein